MSVSIRGLTIQECEIQRQYVEDDLVRYIAGLTGQAAPLLRIDRAKLRNYIGRHRQWSSAMKRIRKRDERAASQCTCSNQQGQRHLSRIACKEHGVTK